MEEKDMKNRFKLSFAIVLVCIFVFAFSACSSSIKGEWTLKEIVDGDTKITQAEIEKNGGVNILTINEDGTARITRSTATPGGVFHSDFWWTLEDDTLTLYENQEKTEIATEMTYQKGKIVYVDGDYKEVYVKK